MAHRDLEDMIAQVNQARDAASLWQLVLDWFHRRGFPMVAYSHFVGSLRTDPDPIVVADGFPEAFIAEYLGKQLYRVSPIPEVALRAADPVYWRDVERINSLLESEAHFLRQASRQVAGDGLSIAVFGPQRRNGVFGLGHGAPMPALSGDMLGMLQVSAQMFHMAYCKLRLHEPEDAPAISPREREILTWIARGKSNAVIADILGISRHTVDTHVRRLFEKLDVNDRTTAAVKALGAGLIVSGSAH